jgi:formate--tetrahydrofolate ligase
MPSDVAIAQAAEPRPLHEIAAQLGVENDSLRPYGTEVAKLPLSLLASPRQREQPSRLVLVSAITPTPAGEGKTTTSIGLAQAMARIGESACLALREPSMGPVFGQKGGATGGGYSQLLPMERLNLHFTGDFHAITSAHNLLAALLDNHLHQGNALNIDPRRVLWRRVIDMNDRALRRVIVGLGGPMQGVPRETGFDITAASEVMAVLCLAEGVDDLRDRLARLLVAFTRTGEPVLAGELGATGAMLALLQDALEPNLVQTLEGTPAIVHGGPFANIAHGCSSVLGTRLAMQLSDWAITEAGFGFDLGAEKFFDIKCTSAGLEPAAVVLVATIRALKLHGGVARRDLGAAEPAAVERGLPNLEKHIENIRCFGERLVVAINRFADDTDEELDVVRRCCDTLGVRYAVSEHHARGGEGAEELARAVVAEAAAGGRPFQPLYGLDASIPEKIEAVASKMYGARAVVFTKAAKRDLREIERLGYAKLPVCLAKVPGSLTDDPKRRGRPRDFDITVRELQINAGAGFLVVFAGDIVRMPGLPRSPLAEQIDVRAGRITGLE